MLFSRIDRQHGHVFFVQILNRDGNDIDIAVNDQSGVQLAHNVNEYLTSLGQETRTIAVIQVL